MLIWLLIACNGGDTDDSVKDTEVIDPDEDHDGAPASVDCDDNDPDVRPAAPETCDGVDEDCNGEIDDEAIDAPLWYTDADGDGYGAPGVFQDVCEAPAGTVGNDDDCDDTDPSTSPLGAEVCGDAKDQDCDGTADDACALSGEIDTSGAFGTFAAGADAVLVTDLDGDGALDLVSGGGGAVTTWFGPLSAGAHTSGDLVLTGGASFGAALAAGSFGDTDAVDLVVGDPTDAGSVSFFTGGRGMASPWGTLTAPTLGVGTALGAGVWQTIPTLLVGTADPGAVGELGIVYTGLPGGASTDFFATYQGAMTGDLAGSRVAIVGDTDGDGMDDVLVGAPGYADGESGRAWLFNGPLDGAGGSVADARTTFVSGSTGEAGSALAGAGDLDGDGYADVVIGGPGVKQGSATLDVGNAWVFRGPTRLGEAQLEDARTIIAGVGASDRCGVAVAGGGDVNDDGTSDLAVTCSNGTDPGVVALFFGPVDTGTQYYTKGDVQVTGEAGFGMTVHLPPDLTGDGVDDLVLTAPGAVYLLAGAP